MPDITRMYKAFLILIFIYIAQSPILFHSIIEEKKQHDLFLELNARLLEEHVTNLLSSYSKNFKKNIENKPYIDQSGSWVIVVGFQKINLLEKSFEFHEKIGRSLSFIFVNSDGRVIFKSPDQIVSFGEKFINNEAKLQKLNQYIYFKKSALFDSSSKISLLIALLTSLFFSLFFLFKAFYQTKHTDGMKFFERFLLDAQSDYFVYLSCINDIFNHKDLSSAHDIKTFWEFLAGLQKEEFISIRKTMKIVSALFKDYNQRIIVKIIGGKKDQLTVFDQNILIIISIMIVEILILSQSEKKKIVSIKIKRDEYGIRISFSCDGPFIDWQMRERIIQSVYKNGRCRFLDLNTFNVQDFNELSERVDISVNKMKALHGMKGTEISFIIYNSKKDVQQNKKNIVDFQSYQS